jgi:hypothetical protein
LAAAWSRVKPLAVKDVEWGMLHAGHTDIPSVETPSPSDFTGWISPVWAERELEQTLQSGTPSLTFAAAGRALRWKIAPDDFEAGLALIEHLWTDETTEWAPGYLLENHTSDETWLNVARAIQENDQVSVNKHLVQAKGEYSPAGYCILKRGYSRFVQTDPEKFRIKIEL